MKKGIGVFFGIVGAALGVMAIGGLYYIIPEQWFIPAFILLPIVILVLLNLLGSSRNLPMFIKSFGFVAMFSCVCCIVIHPMRVTILTGRKLPWILGVGCGVLVFVIFFIAKLDSLGHSLTLGLGMLFLMGMLVPGVIYNVNMIYDGSEPTVYEARVAEVIKSYGSYGGVLRMNREDFADYKIYLKVGGDVQGIDPGDKVTVVTHDGFLHIKWCEVNLPDTGTK